MLQYFEMHHTDWLQQRWCRPGSVRHPILNEATLLRPFSFRAHASHLFGADIALNVVWQVSLVAVGGEPPHRRLVLQVSAGLLSPVPARPRGEAGRYAALHITEQACLCKISSHIQKALNLHRALRAALLGALLRSLVACSGNRHVSHVNAVTQYVNGQDIYSTSADFTPSSPHNAPCQPP